MKIFFCVFPAWNDGFQKNSSFGFYIRDGICVTSDLYNQNSLIWVFFWIRMLDGSKNPIFIDGGKNIFESYSTHFLQPLVLLFAPLNFFHVGFPVISLYTYCIAIYIRCQFFVLVFWNKKHPFGFLRSFQIMQELVAGRQTPKYEINWRDARPCANAHSGYVANGWEGIGNPLRISRSLCACSCNTLPMECRPYRILGI